MAFMNENTMQDFSYAGPCFHAPQIFREKIFSRSHLTVSLSLDDYLLFLTEDYLVVFPSFFLRFNRDGSISFLEDSHIQKYRRNIFGIPLHLVSDIAADDGVPAIHTACPPHGRTLPNLEVLRETSKSVRNIPKTEPVRNVLGCVKMEIGGTLYHFSVKNAEHYNRLYYHNSDYLSAVNHFNDCVFRFHRELEQLVSQGILFPARELMKRRDARREKIDGELERISGRISVLEQEMKEEGFSLSPLRIRERRLMKEQKASLQTKYREWQDRYRYL